MTNDKKQFRIIIERDIDGYFVASVPSLPGCHTQAKTFDELNKRIKEAISQCLEVAREDPQYRARIKDFAYDPVFVGLETMRL